MNKWNVALYGAGEYTDSVNEIDRYLIDRFKLTTVAAIPTAAGQEKDAAKWLDRAEHHYKKLSLKVIPIPMFRKEDMNRRELVDKLALADWIFLSGGDPAYLLNCLKNSDCWAKVEEKLSQGCLLSGSSAGAMVLGSFVLVNPFKAIFRSSPSHWEPGLGLYPSIILPHFNQLSRSRIGVGRITNHLPAGQSWRGIDENTALLIEGGIETVLGKGRVVTR